MRINADLTDLRAFALLAELGHFTRTADALAITPSALSRRIAKLEDALGGRLLDRTTRSVSLTPVGLRFHARLATLLESLDACLEDTHRRASGLEGKIVVACFASLSHTLFPQVLTRFRHAFPNVEVGLRDGNGVQVLDAVLAREAEFGLTTVTGAMHELVSEPLGQDRYMLVCPRAHPLAQRPSVSWQELSQYRVLSFNPAGSSRRQIDPILQAQGIALPWFHEIDQLSSMIGHLEQGEFMAVIPGLMGALTRDTVCVALDEPVIHRSIALVRRHDTSLSSAGQALWSELKTALSLRLQNPPGPNGGPSTAASD
jgi:DNA-binding transcriptional LysR family regulator